MASLSSAGPVVGAETSPNPPSPPPPEFYQVRASITVANTDAAGTNATESTDTFPLTPAVIGLSTDAASLPFLSANWKLNADAIMRLPYDQRAALFFDRALQTKYLRPPSGGSPPTADPAEQPILRANFANMLILLFPTTLPVIDQVVYSGEPVPPGDLVSWTDVGMRLVPYSYLTRASTVLTVTKTTWVNDVRNNPRYAEIIAALRTFGDWRARLLDSKNVSERMFEVIKLMKLFKLASDAFWATLAQLTENPDPEVRAEYREFDAAVAQIKALVRTNPVDAPPDKWMDSLPANWYDVLADSMRRIKNLDQTLSAQPVRSTRYLQLQRAINEMTKYRNVYRQAESQKQAIDAITNINVQYTVNPDLAAYVTASYPPFAQFVEKLRAFHTAYVLGNPAWRASIDRLIQSVENNDVVFEQLVQVVTEGAPIEYQAVGFDSPKTGGNASATSAIRTVLAELSMDVIAGRIDRTNAGLIKCAFSDHWLGALFLQNRVPVEYRWRLPPRMFFDAREILATAAANQAKPPPPPKPAQPAAPPTAQPPPPPPAAQPAAAQPAVRGGTTTLRGVTTLRGTTNVRRRHRPRTVRRKSRR